MNIRKPLEVERGRVDHLAHGMFQKLLTKQANPEIRLICRIFEPEIRQCFEEHLGPGTRAHKAGKRLVNVFGGDK